MGQFQIENSPYHLSESNNLAPVKKNVTYVNRVKMLALLFASSVILNM